MLEFLALTKTVFSVIILNRAVHSELHLINQTRGVTHESSQKVPPRKPTRGVRIVRRLPRLEAVRVQGLVRRLNSRRCGQSSPASFPSHSGEPGRHADGTDHRAPAAHKGCLPPQLLWGGASAGLVTLRQDFP